jgi:nitric oxide reductase subunit C
VNGAAIFANGLADKPNMPTCASCHYVEPVALNDKVGPVMAGVAGRAGRGERGPSPILYLRNSIVAPNDYVVPNENGKVYAAGGMSLMYQDYAKDLTPAQIADLVAYLLTLR